MTAWHRHRSILTAVRVWDKMRGWILVLLPPPLLLSVIAWRSVRYYFNKYARSIIYQVPATSYRFVVLCSMYIYSSIWQNICMIRIIQHSSEAPGKYSVVCYEYRVYLVGMFAFSHCKSLLKCEDCYVLIFVYQRLLNFRPDWYVRGTCSIPTWWVESSNK